MVHLTADELVAYTNGERKKWNRWFVDKPQGMSVPAQRQVRFPTVGSLIDHIFLVERRHLQRLTGQTPQVAALDQKDVINEAPYGGKTYLSLRGYAHALRLVHKPPVPLLPFAIGVGDEFICSQVHHRRPPSDAPVASLASRRRQRT